MRVPTQFAAPVAAILAASAMIAKGNIHGNGGKLAVYLMTGEEGERVELVEHARLRQRRHPHSFRRCARWRDSTHCHEAVFHTQTRLAPGEHSPTSNGCSADREEKRLGFAGQPRIVSVSHRPGDRRKASARRLVPHRS